MRTSFPSSPTLVVDSNLAVWAVMPILSGIDLDLVDRFADWQRTQRRLIAPMLWLAECISAIRFAVYTGTVLVEEGRAAVEALSALQVETIPMDAQLCQAAFEWAGRLGQAKAYDGFYLALAEGLGAEFWTADKRLANAARQLGASWAHWIGES